MKKKPNGPFLFPHFLAGLLMASARGRLTIALWLIAGQLTLGLPTASLALRTSIEGVQAGLEDSVRAAGLEEVRPETIKVLVAIKDMSMQSEVRRIVREVLQPYLDTGQLQSHQIITSSTDEAKGAIARDAQSRWFIFSDIDPSNLAQLSGLVLYNPIVPASRWALNRRGTVSQEKIEQMLGDNVVPLLELTKFYEPTDDELRAMLTPTADDQNRLAEAIEIIRQYNGGIGPGGSTPLITYELKDPLDPRNVKRSTLTLADAFRSLHQAAIEDVPPDPIWEQFSQDVRNAVESNNPAGSLRQAHERGLLAPLIRFRQVEQAYRNLIENRGLSWIDVLKIHRLSLKDYIRGVPGIEYLRYFAGSWSQAHGFLPSRDTWSRAVRFAEAAVVDAYRRGDNWSRMLEELRLEHDGRFRQLGEITQRLIDRMEKIYREKYSIGLEEATQSVARELWQGMRSQREMVPVVVSPAAQKVPLLKALSGLEEKLILMDEGDPAETVTRLIELDARNAVFVGLEEESQQFIPTAERGGIAVRPISLAEPKLLLTIISQAIGLEESFLESQRSFQQFAAGLESLATGA